MNISLSIISVMKKRNELHSVFLLIDSMVSCGFNALSMPIVAPSSCNILSENGSCFACAGVNVMLTKCDLEMRVYARKPIKF